MPVSIRVRRDSSQAWEQNNPVLFQGEFGLDLTNKRVKLGDGFTEWTNLNYLNDEQFTELRAEFGNETDFQIHLELAKL